MRVKFSHYFWILLFFTIVISAQEYEKINGAWNAVFFDYGLNKKLSFRSEFHLRTVSFLDVWDQQIFRPSIIYSKSKNLKWTAGYSFIKNFNSNVSSIPRVRREHNLWEQLVYMTRAGLFDDVDIALHWHADSKNSAGIRPALANKSAKFRFYGVSAHAAGAPEKGRSSLDAVEAMNNMVNMMREHTTESTRIHYVITKGGEAPNVVPD
ncbi:DUF2490 domain-containing protein, partial [Flavobacteriaceae bacterium]|nr:DUF2490 domain-containing protein [Flavobacteriaceae bacterium]